MRKFVVVTMFFFVASICLFSLLQGVVKKGGDDSSPHLVSPMKKDKEKYKKESILVKFSKSTKESGRRNVLKKVNGSYKDKNGNGKDDRFENILDGRLALVELKGDKKKDKAKDALDKLKKHKGIEIEYACYNSILHAEVVPNDSNFSQLWAMNNTGQTGGTADADIDAAEAWDTTTGSKDIVVGVIDTGLNYNHPDLAPNAWVNPNEIAGNNIDDDGNGYIDDVHGINAITGTGNPMDDEGHGSHCSGSIGAAGNNGIGVAGVNWNVSIIGMKFLDSGGSGTTADAITCIDYAIWLKNNGVNIKVLSNSYGGGGYEQVMYDAVSAANDAGLLFVAAAGNDSTNNDSYPHYPSNYDVPNVLSVASTTHNDGLSYFSNYGATSVDLGAPGSDILSTVLGSSYSSYSGTSMATPHVAGAAALVLSVNNNLTPVEIKDLLMNSGDSISALSGSTLSGKRINLKNAVDLAPPPEPGYKITVDNGAAIINQGETANYNLNFPSVMSYTGNVSLSAVAAPAFNGGISFAPNPAVVDGTAVMTVTTSTATTVGDYSITVTGVSGSITKTASVNLKVRPEGTVEVYLENNTPVTIPDYYPAGITSTIDVAESFEISNASVTVNITHTYIGDLRVRLMSPAGTIVTLHNRGGGSTNNLNKTYEGDSFNGEYTAGTWTLQVSDHAGWDYGTLDSWALTLTGASSAPATPTAEFTASSTTIIEDGYVTFSDLSSGEPDTWSWVFEGGTPAVSTEQNPTVTYATAGTYSVTLTVSNGAGDDTETKAGYVTVNPLQAPVANFSALSTSIMVGTSVPFTDLSTNSPTSWAWTFEGGTPDAGVQQNPTVTYNTAGTYSVTLVATNEAGSHSFTRTGYITVNDQPVAYCDSYGGSQSYEWVAGVTVGDLTNNSDGADYSDYTGMTANLTAGGTVNVTLTPGFGDLPFTEYWGIFIDYNGDGDFDDAGENVFNGSGMSTVNGSFSVPAGASGITRMRVILKYGGAPAACGFYGEGETEDYTVTIQ